MTHNSRSRRDWKPPVKTREDMPRMTQTKEGTVIWCPFCVPSHPLLPGQPAPCGTQLKLTAVQTIIPARFARMKKLTCLKCHRSGEGDMVQYMSGFIHLQDCTPGTNLLREMPHFSKWAAWVYGLPKGLRAQVCKYTGYPQQVREIDTDGKETGKVLGYFFISAQKGTSNASGTPIQPAA